MWVFLENSMMLSCALSLWKSILLGILIRMELPVKELLKMPRELEFFPFKIISANKHSRPLQAKNEQKTTIISEITSRRYFMSSCLGCVCLGGICLL